MFDGMATNWDAVIIGAGHNSLACACHLSARGWKVAVYEQNAEPGGAVKTGEYTLPGFRHDLCSAIHPLGLGSPFFREVPLEKFGLEWIQPDIPLAHPLDDGTAVAQHQSYAETAASIGLDGPAWIRLLHPLATAWPELAPALLGPLPISRHLLPLSRFGLNAVPPARWLAEHRFDSHRAVWDLPHPVRTAETAMTGHAD